MTWNLSQDSAGNLEEVRSKEEVLAALDARGCLDGMPSMPEMLQFCGRCFRVGLVAHKTCDRLVQRRTLRRLQVTVHLSDLPCEGNII